MVGWRLWHAVERGAELRLRSPLYVATWPTRRELAAVCRPRTEAALALYWQRNFPHQTPDERCGCGIYAGRAPAQAVAYMSRFFKPRGDVVHKVLGTVSLWGRVIECEQGWRGSFAYPAHIYVPAPERRRFFRLGRVQQPLVSPVEVAVGLADYGVPVELVECETLRELAEKLTPAETPLPAAA
jgi:hypothetical protein